MDDPRNNLNIARKEVKEGTGSSTGKGSNDIIRRRALAYEAALRRHKEADKENRENRENKDINSPNSPSIETEEYKGIRENVLWATQGRVMETIAPGSPKVEPQGLSQERQIELSKQVLSEIRLAGDLKRKPLVDTKLESDRNISASDNTDVPTYTGEEAIKQIEALEAKKTGGSFYAYWSEGEIHITSEEKAKAKLGNEAMDRPLGEAFYTKDTPPKKIRRIDLEDAKNGIRVAESKLKLDITALQVEKPQDKEADAIEAKEDQEKTVKKVRGSAFAKLGHEIRNQQVWSESADSWKNPRMDLSVMKGKEPLAFKNQEDGAVTVTWNNDYSRPNETPVALNYAERIINEKGIDGVKWDLPTVYALKSEPKNLGDKQEVIVTDHKETANALKDKWGYQSLGELKIGQQDQQQKWTSVEEFLGPDLSKKLPQWMQDWMKKGELHLEDFEEYQKNKSLTREQFMNLVQNKPLESETMPALKPEGHDDQGEADIKEKLSRVEKTFAEDKKGKAFIELKDKLDKLYGEISKVGVSEKIFEQAEEQKDRADMYPIQMEAFFKLKEANPSSNEQYEIHYNSMVKDMNESVEFMQKALDQNQKSETQEGDTPARSVAAILRTGRVNFMQRVDFYGNNKEREASLSDYDKIVSDVEAIEDRLLKKGISQKDIYKQVEGRVGYYEGRINAAIEIGDIGREHSLPLEDTTRRIKEDLIEFEAKEDFVSLVEDVLGKKGSTDKTRQFSEKVYDDLKAKGVDDNRIRLSMDIIEKNKKNIMSWLEDEETTESHMNEASEWLMDQVDQLLPRRNNSSIDEPYTNARTQFEREMGNWGTGETKA